MVMAGNINIRRQFKYLLKDYFRGKITNANIQDILVKKGIWCGHHWLLIRILKTNIKSRVISRLGRAALKAGGYIWLEDLIGVYKAKFHKYDYSKYKNLDYHTIKFVKPVKEVIVEKRKKVSTYLTDLKGNIVSCKFTTSEDFDKNQNVIVSAAMLMNDDLIVPGVRHFSPEMRLVLKRIYGDNYHLQVKEQGFIDNKGNFLTREAAWDIAMNNGQINYQVSKPGTLYSENLY